MSDFLLELRCEEIPARMQAAARRDLEKLFRAQMDAAGVALGDLTVWSTPRRLALIARDLPDQTEAVREETKGPAAAAPEQALAGFLRKVGLEKDQLEIRDIKGKDIYFAVVEKPGRAVRDVLAEAIPTIIRSFPWPKSQRWGAASISTESLRWVRPLSGIVAIFGEELVECAVEGISASYATMGHRFHHPGEITIGGADDYADKLRACHVIVDHTERQDMIREGAAKAAQSADLSLVEDEGLVIENAGLTEWPVPLLGRFDSDYLEVPPEVIQLTARTNQKYFVCEDGGKLTNAFVCTANIEAEDGGEAIVAGNRKVLAARLSDARFFWDQDRKKTLKEHAEGLERITFHEKLGTVADKVERVAKLARWLVEEGIVKPSPTSLGQQADKAAYPLPPGEEPENLANLAEQAALLCKADLTTEMVGEFPELQGLMGGYYARAEGLPDVVADAIRDHYKPVGQGDDVPTAPVTVAVSLADKLDTLICFFAIKERPTGSKDPFALRRAMLGIIELLTSNGLRLGVRDLVREAYRAFADSLTERRFVLWQDFENENNWSRLLEADAAFKGGFGELYVLVEEPPMLASDFGEKGKEKWNPMELRQRGHLDFEVCGFTETTNEITEFCFERVRDREKRAGRRPDLISAVLPRETTDIFEGFGIGSKIVKLPNTTANDDIIRILNLGAALQAFITTEDGTNLLAGYKRAANILKKEDWRGIEGEIPQTGEEDPLAMVDDPDIAAVVAAKMEEKHRRIESELRYSPEPAEKALIDALDAAGPKAAAAVEAEDFAAAMAALASLRAPIDAFFDNVTVNDPDKEKRTARLALLDRFRVAVHNVADFSKIES